jgi:hypothetical protein
MKYIKYFESYLDNFAGAPIVNNISREIAAGSSDGIIAGSGNSGAFGGEWQKPGGPNSSSGPDRFKQTVKSVKTKESIKRRNAIKKLKKLNIQTLKSFDEFNK